MPRGRPMSQDNPESITNHAREQRARRVFWIVLAGVAIVGAGAAWHYAATGLTLSHYDARAHLVVTRRVADSLTPGWRQFGAVWLPLPHFLSAPVMFCEFCYRTGATTVAVSVAAIAVGLAALSRFLFLWTGSMWAAVSAAVLAMANPNVLYLQSTPMTEPLLFGLSLISLALLDTWLAAPTSWRARRAGAAMAGLVLTRYEGWLVAGALIALTALLVRIRRQHLPAALWLMPVLAITGFLVGGWASTGRFITSTDFFVPDPELLHKPAVVIGKMADGVVDLAGPLVPLVGLAGVLAGLWQVRKSPHLSLVAALVTPAVLPFVAFYAGHPFRIRYLVPLVLASAALASLAIAGLPRRLRAVAAVALCAGALWTRAPFDPKAPMLLEAQWETPFRLQRERVTAELVRRDDGSPILASMGSLAHYMHETSRAGIPLRRFLHEGNGDLWIEALKSPRRSVRWILIEERAEGGDQLAARARDDASFLEGFQRVVESGGLTLYERRPGQLPRPVP